MIQIQCGTLSKQDPTKPMILKFSSGKEINSCSLVFIRKGAEPIDLPLKIVDGKYEVKYTFGDTEFGEFKIQMNKRDVLGYIKLDTSKK